MDANHSTLESEQKIARLHVLNEVLLEQIGDLQILRNIVVFLMEKRSEGIDEQSAQTYTAELDKLWENQKNRYILIDQKINENNQEIRKKKTDDRIVIVQGKEVRKLEGGIRTLLLFANDIVEMLKPNSKVINRVDDRLSYFNKRSSSLEGEIRNLQVNMPKE